MENLIFFAGLALMILGLTLVAFKERGAKITGLISIFIGSGIVITHLSDMGGLSIFVEEHRVLLKGLLMVVASTALIISAFNLYRIFVPREGQANHFLEEAIIGTLHANYFATLFFIDQYVKSVGEDREKGKKIFHEFLYGLVGASFILLTILLPLAMAGGLYVTQFFQFKLFGLNVMEVITYLVTIGIGCFVVLYWINAVLNHRHQVRPGHDMLVYCRTKLMFIKGPTEGDILAPGGFCKVIQMKKYLSIECSAKGLTCVGEERRMRAKAKMTARIKIKDTTVVLNNELSLEALEEDIIIIMRSCYLAEIGKITGEVAVRDKDKLDQDIKKALAAELLIRGGGNLELEELLIQKVGLRPSELMAA